MSSRVGSGGRHRGGKKNPMCPLRTETSLTMATILKVTATLEQYATGLRISTRRSPREPMTCNGHFQDNARADKGRPYAATTPILIIGVGGDLYRGERSLAQ